MDIHYVMSMPISSNKFPYMDIHCVCFPCHFVWLLQCYTQLLHLLCILREAEKLFLWEDSRGGKYMLLKRQCYEIFFFWFFS
jgi:hypothetical protein